MEQIGKEVESIKSNYDEDEFQEYFIENCDADILKQLLEMSEEFEWIGEAFED
jgi:hypothetical protein